MSHQEFEMSLIICPACGWETECRAGSDSSRLAARARLRKHERTCPAMGVALLPYPNPIETDK